MQTMRIPRCSRPMVKAMLGFVSASALAMLTGCGIFGGGSVSAGGSSASSAPASTTLWANSQDFVKLEPGEAGGQQALDITGDQVMAALSQLRVRWGNGQTEPVFSTAVLEQIASPIAQGLQHEQPGTDVVFAAAFKPEDAGILQNLFAQRRITTGRVFYDGHTLNIIFGLMHQSFEQQLLAGTSDISRQPGERDQRVSTGWVIEPAANMKLHSPTRPDWVLISAQAWASVPQQQASTRANAGEMIAPGPATHAESRGSANNFGPSTGNAYYQTAHDRLQALKRLRDDGLISRQEYQKERASILKQLGSLPSQ